MNGETTNSTSNVIARMPIQGVSPGSLYTDSVFIANYNALQVSVLKRMSPESSGAGQLHVVQESG